MKTSAELRSLFGQPAAPCPECQSVLFWVTHSGEIVCRRCKPDQESIAFEAVVIQPAGSPDGSGTLAELGEALRAERERVEAAARERAGEAALAWTLDHQADVDRWWESLPGGEALDRVREFGRSADGREREARPTKSLF